MRYVIVGNGAAGVNCIEGIRRVDPEGEIINICGEPYPPYSRPLLPHFIEGIIDEDGVFFRPPSFYKDMKVEPILGDSLVAVETSSNMVVLASGERIGYDKLLLATGGKPRPTRIPGVELKNVFHLTTLDAAKEIMRILSEVKTAVILGGGPLGVKAALALSVRGKKVKMLITSPQVMSQVLDTKSAFIMKKKLIERGVEVRVSTSAKAILGDKKVEEVELEGGERIKAELVIIGKGLSPNFSYLNATNAIKEIRVHDGIIVNQFLQTTVPNIYAAGDVAECYDILTGGSSVVAVWPRASEQGYYAGCNMAGFPKEYVGGHRMNSLDFDGLSCIVMGDVRTEKPHFKYLIHEDLKRNIYQRIILEDGKIRGAAIIGRIVNVGGINRFLRRRVNIEPFKASLLEERATFIY